MSRLTVCINCLTVLDGLYPSYPVGHEKGTQRDPYFTEVDLCKDCIVALETGDMAAFHDRYNDNPTVKVTVR